MKKVIVAIALFAAPFLGQAQVGIGTEQPSPSSQLDIKASDRGLLIPRIRLKSPTDATSITHGNVESLLVYHTGTSAEMKPGYYFWQDGRWLRLITEADLESSAGTDPQLPTEPGTSLSPENLEAEDASIAILDGEGATLRHTSLKVAEGGISTEKLAQQAVTPEKLAAAPEDAGKVATAQPDGTVSYEALKASLPKFFYMPSILIPLNDRQVDGTYDAQDRLGRINLYARYQEQFGNPMASSEGAQSGIPVLPASELEFHVTYFDERLFEVERISPEGILHYSVKDAPVTEVSFMNIIFVIK